LLEDLLIFTNLIVTNTRFDFLHSVYERLFLCRLNLFLVFLLCAREFREWLFLISHSLFTYQFSYQSKKAKFIHADWPLPRRLFFSAFPKLLWIKLSPFFTTAISNDHQLTNCLVSKNPLFRYRNNFHLSKLRFTLLPWMLFIL